jgi:hypothetical protein
MSDVKLKDLSPVPFFAHFLEGQFSRDLAEEEMKSIRGGMTIATMAYPSDQEGIPLGQLPDQGALMRLVGERLGQIPGASLPPSAVTLAYPSDQEVVPL